MGDHVRRIKGPCPGCGERDLYRRKDGLCQSCQGLLDLGREVHAARKPTKDEQTVRIPWAPYLYRYVPHQGHGHTRPDFQKALDRFIRRAFRPSSGVPDYKCDSTAPRYPFDNPHSLSSGHDYYVIPKHLVRPLMALLLAAIRVADRAYREGQEDGRRFIQRLAKGEIAQLKAEEVL